MKIYVAADHNGFHLRNSLVEYLAKAGYDVVEIGPKTLDPNDDFPLFAQSVVTEVLAVGDGNARGILLCGSGQGMCMAANRFKGIRALLGYDRNSVTAARNDDDANILCLPANSLAKDQINVLAETFINTPFVPVPRYVRRIREMDEVGS